MKKDVTVAAVQALRWTKAGVEVRVEECCREDIGLEMTPQDGLSASEGRVR